MNIDKWALLTIFLGILTGIGYDILGPDSKTVLALGFSTLGSAFVVILGMM